MRSRRDFFVSAGAISLFVCGCRHLPSFPRMIPRRDSASLATSRELASQIGGAASSNAEVSTQGVVSTGSASQSFQVTESGLRYRVITSGDGRQPSTTDRVRVHYQGQLVGGKVFDSSLERGEAAEFPVNGVIPGWTEALLMMHEGDRWELYIPSELAYGARGAGSDIGPNEPLIFYVELLEIV